MRRRVIQDVETFIAAIQDEISHHPEGRYFHRLHVVLCAFRGMETKEISQVYGDSPRAIQYWVRKFLTSGFAGLQEGERPGRPSRLSLSQKRKLKKEMLHSPRELGYSQNLWDGPLLSCHLKERYGIMLQVRQCQYLFHHLGFTLQRPRRKAREADVIEQEKFKKNSISG